jgi:hypothetical protein
VEASTKCCPIITANQASARVVKCVSSNCMAWRWVSEPDGETRVGYCGMAGKPSDVIYDEMREAAQLTTEALRHD